MVCFCGVKEHFMFYIVIIQSTGESLLFLAIASMANNCKTISMAIAIYFRDWIKTVLPFNLLFFLLLVQVIYVGIRWYVKGWRETRGYY